MNVVGITKPCLGAYCIRPLKKRNNTMGEHTGSPLHFACFFLERLQTVPYVLRVHCLRSRLRAGFACPAEGRLKRTMCTHGLAYSLHKFGGVNKILHTWHIGIQNALSVSFPSGFSLADKEYFVGGF
jgi:hypothetical protein